MPLPKFVVPMLIVSMFALFGLAISLEMYLVSALLGFSQVQIDAWYYATILSAVFMSIAFLYSASFWLYGQTARIVKWLAKHEAQGRQQHKMAKQDAEDYVRSNICIDAEEGQ